MIDLHCHILPGLDDGPKTIEESVEMARRAIEEGITEIVATPHHKHPTYSNEASIVRETVIELNKRLREENLDLKIHPGQEVRLYGEVVEDLTTKTTITLADHEMYLFIEFPSNHVPRYAAQLFYQLQLNGYTPIIVHPERNSKLLENPDKLYDFVQNGALTQVTSSSLTGHFGKKIKQFSNQLIEANLTHFVASDAHNVDSRPFRLRESYAEIAQKHGEEKVRYFQENAQLIVENKHVFVEPPEQIRRKKLLGIF
ncbi:CpsB/CapC family capsule biosynthesis tyrosine phosphatase [Alkalihalophilus lindianensis]|uniref:Tyrosine-protein phosphatase n=1 Tax=Alkalihalophilus lindianensis TaxID=1630542 RepID=A0ABU3X964_9BACI|nr:CpsB/CapC family capsule biosynthesis tyrosine phosphatase [Alkalihalophilus lindianensis]MDV2684416.1 CpsB/CapC family capsule biosynthesis tyrosine phosphatase [Alkalihalophilus lindianensis]